jgi:hypothetical protein
MIVAGSGLRQEEGNSAPKYPGKWLSPYEEECRQQLQNWMEACGLRKQKAVGSL